MRKTSSIALPKKLDLGRTTTVRVLAEADLNKAAGGCSVSCGDNCTTGFISCINTN